VNDTVGMKSRWGLLLLSAAAVAMVGCSPSSGTVSGKVYYGDELVKAGTVTFFCADGRGIRTGIRADGSYTVEQVPLGTARVCVDTSALDPKKKPPYSPPPGKKVDLPGANEPDPSLYVAVPPRYATAETTDLTCEVAGGSQSYTVKMKK
jgi:hypothetical protein